MHEKIKQILNSYGYTESHPEYHRLYGLLQTLYKELTGVNS